MYKGCLYDYNGQKILNKKSLIKNYVAVGVIPETTMVIYGVLTAITLISIYAIYKGHKIKVTIEPNGNVTLETNKE